MQVKTEKYFVGRRIGNAVEFMDPEQLMGFSFHNSKSAAREEIDAHVEHGYERRELGIYRVLNFEAERIK